MSTRRTTKTIHLLAALGLVALLTGRAAAADPQYLAAVADLPLPPGLVEDVDAGVSFDKPGGRIVEAIARGTLSSADVVAFYRAALPGLGWQALDDGPAGLRWRRGDETLTVGIRGAGDPLIVRFSLAPN